MWDLEILDAAAFRLPTTNYQLPTNDYQLPTNDYQLIARTVFSHHLLEFIMPDAEPFVSVYALHISCGD